MSLTPSERTMRARLAAHTLHSRYDSRELTKAARAKFEARFYEGIDPDLPEAERDRRAQHARKRYFTELAFKSAKARRKAS